MNRWIGIGAATLLSAVAVLEASPPQVSGPPRESGATQAYDRGMRDHAARESIEREIVAPRRNEVIRSYRMSRAMVSYGARYKHRTETVMPPSREDDYVTFRTYESPRRGLKAERLLAWGRVDTRTKVLQLGVVHPLGVTWIPVSHLRPKTSVSALAR